MEYGCSVNARGEQANKAMQPTLYALSVCMNGRAAHFIMQPAIAHSATDGVSEKKEIHL